MGMIKRTGYIGLGSIGKPIAINVVQGGFDLMVYDLKAEPLQELAALDARIGRSPREVGEHAELVELSVVNDAQVEEVILGKDGILEGARPDTIIAIHSTIHPETARRTAAAAAARGVHVIDAAVSGGAAGARAQTLAYMVGGPVELLERCRPVFATSGSNIFHVGELGMGAATKLAQQIITTVTMLAVSEGFRVAENAGLDLETFDQIVRVSAGQSYIADRWLKQFRSGMSANAADGFYSGLVPAIKLGHDIGVSLPGTALFQQVVRDVVGDGGSDRPRSSTQEAK
jgi:3-hydroxyisobutyrate dehydrogenase-like beta-hydroxyacid dehydrogenase